MEILTVELTFGRYAYGYGTNEDTGVVRKLIWIIEE